MVILHINNILKGADRMNILRAVILIVTLIISGNIANAQNIALYGNAAESCDNSGTGSGEGVLTVVSPNTGEMIPVGPTGFDGISALAFLGDGRIVASGRQGPDTSILIEINPVSGQGTLIGVIGDANNPGECGRVAGLTFDSATDTLYGLGLKCGAGLDRVLFTINPDTAEPTVVGEVGFFGGGNAIAIRQDGTLFAIAWSGTDLSLYTLNRITGLGTLVGVMDTSGITPNGLGVNGLDFHPITQELFGSSTDGGDDTTSYLVSINEDIPSLSVIGQTLDCFDGIVFGPAQARSVPTLSEWGLIAMAGVLGIIGLLAIRRRKATA